MFSNFNPFALSIKLIITFVFPQLDGPTIKARIELGNIELCLVLFCLFCVKSKFLTKIFVCCFIKRIFTTEYIKQFIDLYNIYLKLNFRKKDI